MRNRFLAILYAVLLLFCSSLAYCQDQPVAIGDLNGDLKPDVVVANPSLNNIGIFLNNGSGALGPGTFLAVNGRPDSVSLGDFNSDGHLDILVTVASSGSEGLQLMLGDGHGGFAAPVAVSTGSAIPGPSAVIADFNGDGFLDIAFGVNAAQPQVAIIFGDGHGGFSAPRVVPVANDGTFVTGLVLLDVNKDSKPDLVVNTASVTLHINESFLLINDGAANFSVSHLSSIGGFLGGTAAFVTAVADFNGDGFVDLLFGPGSSSLIMFGDGQGGALYSSSSLPFATPQGFAADIDGNKTIDLVSPALGSYFPGNGHGGFGDPISLSFPQGSALIAVADFNGDKIPDFVLQSGANASVVLNNLTAPANISASTQTLLSLSAATTSVGLPVTLSASVVSYGGVPAGSVTFFDGAQSLGTAPVDIYGVSGLTTSFATAGLHNNLTASFAGTLDSSTNTAFANSNTTSPSSISVNSSQPSASAPTVTLSAFPNPARVLNPVTITANVTSPSGTPTGVVVLRADGAVVATLFPGATPGVFGPTGVSFPSVGLHNLQATYGGDATFPQATSATLVEDIRVSVPSDFTITGSPQNATVRAGQSATFNITITPVGDLTSTVGFSCSGLPAGAACSFSPATLTPGTNPVSTTLTLTTTAQSTAAPLVLRPPTLFVWPLAVAGFFSLLFFSILRSRNATKQAVILWAALASLFLMVSCGGGGVTVTPKPSTGTPTGTSSVTVSATSATNHTTALNITVMP